MKLLIDNTTHLVQSAVTFEAPSAPLQVPSYLYVVELDGDPATFLGKVHNPLDGTFSAPAPVYTLEQVRLGRDLELQKTDWTQIPDAPLTPYTVYEFAEWRQKLRDITENNATADEAMAALKALQLSKPQ